MREVINLPKTIRSWSVRKNNLTTHWLVKIIRRIARGTLSGRQAETGKDGKQDIQLHGFGDSINNIAKTFLREKKEGACLLLKR
jgi:hypothetical protein